MASTIMLYIGAAFSMATNALLDLYQLKSSTITLDLKIPWHAVCDACPYHGGKSLG